MINITSTEPIRSLEHFPTLSEAKKNFKRSTPKVLESSGVSEMFWDGDSDYNKFEKKQKNYICRNILKGEECPYGRRCNAAHFKTDLVIKKCGFGDRCNKIKITKIGGVKNVTLSGPSCMFIHPSETEEQYFLRLGVKEGMLEKPVIDPVNFHFTKMCNSYFDKIECQAKDACTYAHTIDQLKINPCNFKQGCIHVTKDEKGEYKITEGTQKICRFIHPEETRENYAKRVVSNLKRYEVKTPSEKSVSPSAVEDKIIEKVLTSEEPIVLNVPKSVAEEMVQALLASGKKNVHVKTY